MFNLLFKLIVYLFSKINILKSFFKKDGFALGSASHGQVVRLSQQEVGIQMII